VKPRERLRVDSASESCRRCLRPCMMSSPVSSAMTVPRYDKISEQSSKWLGTMVQMRLHVTVGGLGRSMCSRHCQCGIYGNRNSRHHIARVVCEIVMTFGWMESDDYVTGDLSSRNIGC
jgi:hypothetical protein